MTQSIVIQVCYEHNIDPPDFFNPLKRQRRLVKARLVAIDRLREAGFSMRGISRMMRRNYDTIRYWMKPELRARKRAAAIAYRRAHPTVIEVRA